jgi:hypothetical protein
MMNPNLERRRFERLTTLTLLGIRFWDPAPDRQVSDGLEVVARPQTAPHLETPARRTPAGIYAFQDLPGLHDIEYPLIEPQPGALFDQPAASPPEPRLFWVDVHDRYGRFTSLRFDVALPLPYRGLYRPGANASPVENSPARVYLFSNPTRRLTPGLAVVRSCLQERDSKQPAAFALLEVEVAGRKWYGVADRQGCTAVFLPYPTFTTRIGSSPPGLPPARQSWPATVRVRYDPALAAGLDEQAIASLRQLRNQPLVEFWPTETGPESTEATWDLLFAEELVLRTGERPFLWIKPL